ncbi:hypothetical protein E2562_027386 [Oryza meyeriana var. granulata]|uniref:EF-hand domain-containing protein n=1 Tax=Oryza meyeriana var. granulata TaxID=110450 RepID=A0A6G1EQB3_9ORYZ|nr:hypothetical protein E2562_027386 [Oryza meyeriana var. granulata]
MLDISTKRDARNQPKNHSQPRRSFHEAHSPPPTSPPFLSPILLLLLLRLPSKSLSHSVEMKLSIQSFARKLSLPSTKRTWSGGSKREGMSSKNGRGVKRAISRSEASSFASASSSSSSDDTLMARSTPRSVLPAEISRRELEAVLRRLGHEEPSDDELDAVAAIAAEAEAASEEDELMEAFKVFDADGDGRITAEELRGVMVAILGSDGDGCSLDDCRRMIGGVDADGDGFVGFQDFARMMMAATATAATGGPRSSW